MRQMFSRRTVLLALLVLVAGTALWAASGRDSKIDLEPNMALAPQILFIHQDMVTDFPPTGDGVRTGTMRGVLSGTATTNFQFLAVPPPEFAADDLTLFTDVEGDQIVFRVQVQGRFLVHLEGPEADPRKTINLFGGPYTGIYEVIEATGKYRYLIGRKLPCKGVGTTPAKNPALGSVYAEIYNDTFQF
jgi:hypothetical protein